MSEHLNKSESWVLDHVGDEWVAWTDLVLELHGRGSDRPRGMSTVRFSNALKSLVEKGLLEKRDGETEKREIAGSMIDFTPKFFRRPAAETFDVSFSDVETRRRTDRSFSIESDAEDYVAALADRIRAGALLSDDDDETPAEELGRLRRELSELDPEWPEYATTLDRIAVLTREAAETRRPKTEPCFRCEKPVRTDRDYYAIHLHTSGSLIAAGEDVPEENDQGWFAIGPECRRFYRADLVEKLQPFDSLPTEEGRIATV